MSVHDDEVVFHPTDTDTDTDTDTNRTPPDTLSTLIPEKVATPLLLPCPLASLLAPTRR